MCQSEQITLKTSADISVQFGQTLWKKNQEILKIRGLTYSQKCLSAIVESDS